MKTSCEHPRHVQHSHSWQRDSALCFGTGFSHAPASGPGLLEKNRSPRRIAAIACCRLQGEPCDISGLRHAEPACRPFERAPDTAQIIARVQMHPVVPKLCDLRRAWIYCDNEECWRAMLKQEPQHGRQVQGPSTQKLQLSSPRVYHGPVQADSLEQSKRP